MIHLSQEVLPTPINTKSKRAPHIEEWVPKHVEEVSPAKLTPIPGNDIHNIVIAHGYKNQLPDPSLEQRVVNSLRSFFSGKYDRVLLSGGLRNLQSPYTIQGEIAYEYLKKCFKENVMEALEENNLLHVDQRFKEMVRGGEEIVFDNKKHLMITADGNSFVHEWREIVAKLPDLKKATSHVEDVLWRAGRLKRVGDEAIRFGQTHQLLTSPSIQYEVIAHKNPEESSAYSLYYEGFSGLIYALPVPLRDTIIEYLRKKS